VIDATEYRAAGMGVMDVTKGVLNIFEFDDAWRDEGTKAAAAAASLAGVPVLLHDATTVTKVMATAKFIIASGRYTSMHVRMAERIEPAPVREL